MNRSMQKAVEAWRIPWILLDCLNSRTIPERRGIAKNLLELPLIPTDWQPLLMSNGHVMTISSQTPDTEFLDKNWIRASRSPGGAPVLFFKKPGGGLRFCVDYWALNAITERDRYPLPLIKKTMQMLAKSKWLSKVDVRSAFHRLRTAKGDEWKTAIRSRFGSYEWLVTPFGLTGAPSAFQRWINQELGDLLSNICSAYVDDVVIFSNGELDDHWNKVNQVLERLNKAGLKLDPQKYEFARKENRYSGFIVNVEEGVKVDQGKVEAIKSWETASNVKGYEVSLDLQTSIEDSSEILQTSVPHCKT
ncbi:hypothetical protein K3495_g8954 [Podosphaera aphanis]|nr:hypothetical protein K3495_g8954 [Podosphaera aphanis]